MNDGSGQAGKSVAIIGGGIAGLCAGCYAQMNGYRSRIYEMHDLPGGLMTAWERKGYTVDYCIHWLVGSSPAASMNKLWQEVGLIRDREIVDLDVWLEYEGQDGQRVTFWRDLDRLETELCELSPADADLIKRLLKDTRRLAAADLPTDLPPRELMGMFDTLRVGPRMLPWALVARRWGKLTVGELADRFQSPLVARRHPLDHPAVHGGHGAPGHLGVAPRRRGRLSARRLTPDGSQRRAPLPGARG